ncbi:MAG: hypothetical protein AAGI01_01925, partial [Myxococcota bacterium]
MSSHCPETLLPRMVFPLILSMCLLIAAGSGCAPTFTDASCESTAQCFSNEVCEESVCVAPPTGTVDPPEAPTITSFAVTPTTAEVGSTVELSWTVEGAQSVQITSGGIDPIRPSSGEVASGSVMVSLPQGVEGERTFTLTASSAGLDATATAVLTVQPLPEPPSIQLFRAEPMQIAPGESTTLSWRTEGAVSGRILAGQDVVFVIQSANLEDGAVVVTPDDSTSYRLELTNTGGVETGNAQVVVEGRPPVINSFTVSEPTVFEGESVTLRWEIAGADSIVVRDAQGNTVFQMDDPGSTGSVEVTPQLSTIYRATVQNNTDTAERTIAVTVRERLEITRFASVPERGPVGTNFQLEWSIDGTPTSIVLSDDKGRSDYADGVVNLKSSSVMVSPVETTTYTLVAAGSAGQMAEETFTVEIVPLLPTIISFEAVSGEIATGSPATLAWDVVGEGVVTLELDDGSGSLVDVTSEGLKTSTYQTANIPQDTTFTLTARNAGGEAMDMTSVTVGTPVTAMLTSSSPTALEGDPITLTYATTQATRVVLSDSTGQTLLDTTTDLNGMLLVNPSGVPTTTYTLSAEGFAGPVTDTVLTMITPRVRADLSANPAGGKVAAGTSITLTWSTTDAASATLSATDSSGTSSLSTMLSG